MIQLIIPALSILAVTSTTHSPRWNIPLDVSAHTFVKARRNAVKYYTQSNTITGFNYSNTNGYATVTTSSAHGLSAGNTVELADLYLSCNSPTTGNTYYPKPIYADYGVGVNDVSRRANTLTETIVDTIAHGLNNHRL